MPSRRRVLIYSHDTYGLGHLRRTLLIAGRLVETDPTASVLVVTGSPRTQAFQFPEGCDALKLPAVTKRPDGSYRTRSLGVGLDETLRLRTSLIRGAAESFGPDLVLVDHAPVGVLGELAPILGTFAGRADRPRLVLGLREIIDEPAIVENEWRRLDAWKHVDALYDRILVYGDPRIRTTAHEMGLLTRHPGKVRFTGYLGRDLSSHRSAPPDREPFILVTVGGGGDGQKVVRAYARFLKRSPLARELRSVVALGPFMSPKRQDEMRTRLQGVDGRVEVVTFSDELERLVAQASGVISMGGYNSIVEIMAARVPALIVPRTRPRREQQIRAARLRHAVGFRVHDIDPELPGNIERFVGDVIGGAPRSGHTLSMGGLDVVAREVRDLLERPAAQRLEKDGGRISCHS